MTGGYIAGHHRLAGVGVVGTGEAFVDGFLSVQHGEGEFLLHDAPVYLEHPHGLLDRLFFCRVCGVSLLSEKFGGAQEETGTFLPAHDAAPLVDENRKIPPELHPLTVHVSDHRFGGRNLEIEASVRNEYIKLNNRIKELEENIMERNNRKVVLENFIKVWIT